MALIDNNFNRQKTFDWLKKIKSEAKKEVVSKPTQRYTKGLDEFSLSDMYAFYYLQKKYLRLITKDIPSNTIFLSSVKKPFVCLSCFQGDYVQNLEENTAQFDISFNNEQEQRFFEEQVLKDAKMYTLEYKRFEEGIHVGYTSSSQPVYEYVGEKGAFVGDGEKYYGTLFDEEGLIIEDGDRFGASPDDDENIE